MSVCVVLWCAVMKEWWVWSEEGWRGNPAPALTYSSRNAPRGPPGLMSTYDERIFINRSLHISSRHMHCGGIWDLTSICWEQKLTIEALLHRPSYFQGDIYLFFISIMSEIESETAACKAMSLSLLNQSGARAKNISFQIVYWLAFGIVHKLAWRFNFLYENILFK